MIYFEEPFNSVTLKSSGILSFGSHSESLKYLRVVAFTAGHLYYGATNVNGTDCFTLGWARQEARQEVRQEATAECVLCRSGQLILQFSNISTEDLDKEVGLYHGVRDNNSEVNIARSLVSAELKEHINTKSAQLIFSPRSSCSMSSFCRSSSDCPTFSTIHQCGRFTCLSPSASSSFSCSSTSVATQGSRQ